MTSRPLDQPLPFPPTAPHQQLSRARARRRQKLCTPSGRLLRPRASSEATNASALSATTEATAWPVPSPTLYPRPLRHLSQGPAGRSSMGGWPGLRTHRPAPAAPHQQWGGAAALRSRPRPRGRGATPPPTPSKSWGAVLPAWRGWRLRLPTLPRVQPCQASGRHSPPPSSLRPRRRGEEKGSCWCESASCPASA